MLPSRYFFASYLREFDDTMEFVEQKHVDSSIIVFRVDQEEPGLWVRVAESKLLRVNFGLCERGLYALRDFSVGGTIGQFSGQVVSGVDQSPKRRRYVALIQPYCQPQQCIDCEHMGPPYLQYINDARGTTSRNNARMLQSGRVVAKSRIKQGSEILLAYGRDYWRMHD
jgi:hypothetical protein